MLLLLLLIAASVFGQGNEHKVDSIETVLKNSTGLQRARALRFYSDLIADETPAKAMDAVQESLQLATELEDDSVEAAAHNHIATLYYFQGGFDSALYHLRIADRIWTETDNTLGKARGYNSMGATFDLVGNLDSALHYYLIALDLHNTIQNEDGISATLTNLAVIHYSNSNYQEAIDYFKRTLEMELKNGSKENATISMSNIGFCYMMLEEPEKALEYHTQALELRREMGNVLLISRSLNNIGLLQLSLKQYNKAIASLSESTELKRQFGNTFGLAETLQNLAKAYIENKQFKKALPPLHEAQAIADSTGAPPLIASNAGFLAQAYAGSGRYQEAFEAEMIRKQISDSLTLARQDEKNVELMAKFDAIQREMEIDSLTHLRELRDAEIESINRQTNYLVLAIATFGILAIVIFVFFLQKRSVNRKLRVLNGKLAERNRQIKDQNAEIRDKSTELSNKNKEILLINSNLEGIVTERTRNLSEANKELDTFLYQTSHALRAPLMRIIGLFSIARESEDEVVSSEMYAKINETITRMDRMLYKLLDVQEMKLRDPVPIKVDFGQMIEELISDIAERSPLAKPTFKLDLPKESIQCPDRQIVRLALVNTIENAWHFRHDDAPDHTIDIQIQSKATDLLLVVTDNGTGVPNAELESVFGMFHRATHKSIGTGLGLYVTKKALERIGGEISLQSEEGRSTRIEIRIPIQAKQPPA